MMYDNQFQHQIIYKTKLTDEQCSEELLAAREEIKFLCELIDSQKTLIHSLNNQLLQANQELELLDDELRRTVVAKVSFDEAKVIAKQLLKFQQFGAALVANVLSDIYNLSVEPTELQESEMVTRRINQVENEAAKRVIAHSHIQQNSEELHSRYMELSCKFFIFATHLNRIKQQFNTLPPLKIILLMLKLVKKIDIAIRSGVVKNYCCKYAE